MNYHFSESHKYIALSEVLTWGWCCFSWTYLLGRLQNYFKSKYSVNRWSLSLVFSLIPCTQLTRKERKLVSKSQQWKPLLGNPEQSQTQKWILAAASCLSNELTIKKGNSHVPVAHAQCPAHYNLGQQEPAQSLPPYREVRTGRVMETFNIHTSRTNTALLPQLFNTHVSSAPACNSSPA